jgi:hypothetical protein
MWERLAKNLFTRVKVATGNIGDSTDREHRHISSAKFEVPCVEPGQQDVVAGDGSAGYCQIKRGCSRGRARGRPPGEEAPGGLFVTVLREEVESLPSQLVDLSTVYTSEQIPNRLKIPSDLRLDRCG